MKLFEQSLDFATPSLILPLYRTLKRDHSSAHVREIERLNAAGPEQIRAHQLARVRELCAVAVAKTAFYRRRFGAAGMTDPSTISLETFRTLPTLEKADLRDHADELINADYPADRLRASATGGTTASPVRILMDWGSYWRRQSATIVFDRWCGREPGRRTAYLWGARQDFPDDPGWKARLLERLVLRRRFLPASLLDDAIMESYYHELLDFAPRLLQAYPGPLEIFARFLLRRGYRIPLPAISCTAEALLPRQVDVIQRAFGLTPFNWYGSRECGRIATECHLHQGLHVNAWGLLVEVQEDPRFATPGVGPIIVTDLWNVGFPLIRYRTGDIGRLVTEPCACGSRLPRLAELLGRTTDVFINSRGQRIPGVAFTNRVITEAGQIEEMQIIQHDYRRFEILVKPGPDYSPATGELMRQRLDRFMGEAVEAAIRIVAGIPPEPSGKVLFCKCRLEPGAGGS